MKELWKNKRIILLGGPGGVGKTTLAASLGVQFALEGYRTVVLTVDPARRLAQALGMGNFSSELQKIDLPMKEEAQLFASMLDARHYLDRVITRFALNPEQRDKILNHQFYKIMVQSLGGAHEYAAMERLLEFARESDFEKIIVDTPPSQNAIDLFSAPERMAEFMDNSVLRWMQGSAPMLHFFRHGTKLAMKLVERVFGTTFMATLGEVLTDFEGMQAGFRHRHLEVIELLRSPSTLFMLVTVPSEVRYLESSEFLKTLKRYRIPLGALVLNRIETKPPSPISDQGPQPKEFLDAVNALLTYYGLIHTQQAHWIKRLQKLDPRLPLFTVPNREEYIHDVATLSRLAPFLVD